MDLNLHNNKGNAENTGFKVYRASRLEALIPPLWSLLQETWPDNVLSPQTVLAAHPGMKQWLTAKLAEHASQIAPKGQHGIAANLEVILPSIWFEKMARAELGQKAVSLPNYQVAHLRWTLHKLLDPDNPLPEVTDSRVSAYLNSDSGKAGEMARRRFQLADRLAKTYSQYLMYRSDWLSAWEAGQFAYATAKTNILSINKLERELLGPLWKRVASQLGRHRGHAMQDLSTHLSAASKQFPVLHVFGVSHLAPSDMNVLRAYAEKSLVIFYVPDPCREYWGGIEAEQWKSYKENETQRIQDAGDGEYWSDQTHPLLARWGRMGQHFFCELLSDGEYASSRHWQDDEKMVTENRLQGIQEGIRKLDAGLSFRDKDEQTGIEDSSLRIHACHTRQRELEVLRDSLLDALASGIEPGDMMVMSPNIQDYLPLIPSVFGEPGVAYQSRLPNHLADVPVSRGDSNKQSPHLWLPYHLADVPVSRSHVLFKTYKLLLELPAQRICASEVVDFLKVPEIQRRFALDANAIDALIQWLSQSRVAWSLGPDHRAQFGVPKLAAHSFAWAMDRMIAGYLMSDAPDADQEKAFTLPDNTELLPMTGIQGPSAQAIGALDGLLQEVQAWCNFKEAEHTAKEWVVQLERRLEALFSIDKTDKDAREAWSSIQRAIKKLELETTEANENPVLHFSVVHDFLIEQLDGVSEQQRFLMGGVTFCGMVPQRAIPFKMLAVLGLNDGDFPRTSRDGGLDLMSKVRRIGDRDVRNDDRYLFLETVMAARERLHLSYIGWGVKDGKARNPAAPLAELITALETENADGSPTQSDKRPWLVNHPLQPFDGRYFNGSDARLYSFESRFAQMQGNGNLAAKPFLLESSGAPDVMPNPLALSQLKKYYKAPAEQVLKTRLKLNLEALNDERLKSDEPIAPTIDKMASVAKKVFFADALPNWGNWQSGIAPDWVRLSGLLPLGKAGHKAWENEAQAVNDAFAETSKLESFNAEIAGLGQQVVIDFEMPSGFLKGIRMTGQVANVFPMPNSALGQQLLRVFPSLDKKKDKLKEEKDLHFSDRVPIFLDWALLRLQTAYAICPLEPVKLHLIVKTGEKNWQMAINQWDENLLNADGDQQQIMLNDLCTRVGRLGFWWQEAQRLPHWYFPNVSWQAVVNVEKYQELSELAEYVQTKWDGFENSGEKNYAPGYSAYIANDVDFTKDIDILNKLIEFSKDLNEKISFKQVDDHE